RVLRRQERQHAVAERPLQDPRRPHGADRHQAAVAALGRRLQRRLLMPGWLERGIAAVAPSVALRREEARMKLARASAVRNLYEGATYSRRAQGWRAPLS